MTWVVSVDNDYAIIINYTRLIITITMIGSERSSYFVIIYISIIISFTYFFTIIIIQSIDCKKLNVSLNYNP